VTIHQSDKKPDKKIDPLSLDDVPKLGPIKIKALEEEGYTTALQVACKSPTFLKEVCDMDREEAGIVLHYIKNKLKKAGILEKQELTALELLKRRKLVKRLKIGCNNFDKLLDGGIECGAMTQFYGEFGSGKTQMVHNLAIQAQLPREQGGFAEKDKPPPIVLIIDSEKTTRSERFLSIMAGKGIIPTKIPAKIRDKLLAYKELDIEEQKEYNMLVAKQEKEGKDFLNHIEIQEVTDTYQLFLRVQNLLQVMEHVNIKLVLIDSMVATARGEYIGRGNMKAKSEILNEMLRNLKIISENYKIPIVIINQIYHRPEEDYGRDPDVFYGGNILAHTVTYHIKLKKSGKKRKAIITKSPYQANDEATFILSDAGISDPN